MLPKHGRNAFRRGPHEGGRKAIVGNYFPPTLVCEGQVLSCRSHAVVSRGISMGADIAAWIWRICEASLQFGEAPADDNATYVCEAIHTRQRMTLYDCTGQRLSHLTLRACGNGEHYN